MVRNLGIDLADPDTEPMALIPKVTSAESDGTYVIDCSNLSPKARRQVWKPVICPCTTTSRLITARTPKFQVATVDQDYPNTPSLSVDFRGNEAGQTRDVVIYQNNENVTPVGVPRTQPARTADYTDPSASGSVENLSRQIYVN